MKKHVVCIPVVNAGNYVEELSRTIYEQTANAKDIFVVDTSSTDDTSQKFKSAGAKVHLIRREEFDHGKTRNIFLALVGDVEILIFLTQDITISDPRSFENLLQCFSDPTIGAAYGRQLPRPGAGPIEAHARLFNYQAKSQIKSLADIPVLGIKTTFISNSFAAYRRTALEAVGRFPENVILSEDAFVAAKMLLSGWKIAYCAEAQVHHSHNYSYLEEFRRYFDIGVFHGREPWIRNSFGRASREGFLFVRSELKFLWPRHFYLIPSAIVRSFLKFVAFKLGVWEGRLPLWLKTFLSMNKNFWLSESSRRDAASVDGTHMKRSC